jgi:hypothetical protein
VCNIDYVFRHWDPGTVRVSSVSAVEVTRTDDGVVVHAGPRAPGVGIPRRGWADFVAAVRGGEFDATLDGDDALRTGDVTATDAVEVTRTGGGVFLRVLPGAGIVHIPRREWWDFIAGVHGGEFDDTLPENEGDPPPDTTGSPVVVHRRPGPPGGHGPDTRGNAVDDAERYENALRWVGHIATAHYFGRAFDPEHMRALANLALDVLAGRELPDYQTAAGKAMERARKHAAELAVELAEQFAEEADDSR